MSFPTDWDVDKYKVEHESEEHWELRRRFLVTHKDKFPEDRLVCLAQVFYNVEFMGCLYPKKTMTLVAKLSKEIAEEHREKMKSKLQRTFVQASDAASTKIKGHEECNIAAPKSKVISFQKSADIGPFGSKQSSQITNIGYHDNVPGRYVRADQSRFHTKDEKKRTCETEEMFSNKSLNQKKKSINTDEEMTMSKFVIVPTTCNIAINTLRRSFEKSKMNLEIKTDKLPSGESEISICVNGQAISKAANLSTAAEEALQNLRRSCYTLIIKDQCASALPVVEKDAEMEEYSECNKLGNVPSESKEVSEAVMDDKAKRMMKLMGWSGKGLGRNEQGREEPVMATRRVSRAGLGANATSASLQPQIRKVIQDFARTGGLDDLVFAADFLKQEREIIHRIARRFGLKSTSFGKEPNRRIVLSKKKMPWQIVEEVLQAGGCTQKYEVIPPTAN